MTTNFNWKKGIFANEYSIYSDGKPVGRLKEKTFSQTALGELNDKKYVFKTKGFLKQRTDILDASESKLIGKINYNSWMNKAAITVNGKTVSWKYNNAWNTKWSLYDTGGTLVKYAGSGGKGQIQSDIADELLILSGLYVTNYYWQMTIVVLVAVFIPLWTTVLS